MLLETLSIDSLPPLSPVAISDEMFDKFKLIANAALKLALRADNPSNFVYWFYKFLPNMEKNQFTVGNYDMFFEDFPRIE